MRKNYLFIIFLLGCTFASAQKNANPAQLPELLTRLELAGNSVLSEPENLFSEAERSVLQNHFRTNPDFNNSELALGDVYLLNIRATPRVYGTVPVTGPFTINSITTFTDAYFAGDFTSSGVLYGYNSVSLNIDIIDKDTGAITTVAPLSGLVTGHNVTGMSWNHANSTMYLSSTNGTATTLYTLNLATAALTTIGTTGNPAGIWIAINSTGAAYMADITTDNLYSINLTTGAGTLIGPLGINIAFAQGADFDSSNDTLYMTAYIGAGVNQFASVNTATGAATSLGTINANNAECDISAIYRNNLSINEANLEDAFVIFPVPSDSEVNIISNQNIAVRKATIYDLSGRMVKEFDLNGSVEQTISIANLDTGIYSLSVETERGTFTKRLAKK